MFLQKRNCELLEEDEGYCIEVNNYDKKNLIERIIFLPPVYSEARCDYVFDKSAYFFIGNEKTADFIPVPPYLPSRMCA